MLFTASLWSAINYKILNETKSTKKGKKRNCYFVSSLPLAQEWRSWRFSGPSYACLCLRCPPAHILIKDSGKVARFCCNFYLHKKQSSVPLTFLPALKFRFLKFSGALKLRLLKFCEVFWSIRSFLKPSEAFWSLLKLRFVKLFAVFWSFFKLPFSLDFSLSIHFTEFYRNFLG